MKITKLAKLFRRLTKLAYIKTPDVLNLIMANKNKIITQYSTDVFEQFEFKFGYAFSAHDELYDSIASLDRSTAIGTMLFAKKDFDKLADKSLKAATRLVDFLKSTIITDEIEQAKIAGRFELVQKGHIEALEYYFRFTAINKPMPMEGLVKMSFGYHSALHGFLEYLLIKSLEIIDKQSSTSRNMTQPHHAS